jgi:hypothetical protein
MLQFSLSKQFQTLLFEFRVREKNPLCLLAVSVRVQFEHAGGQFIARPHVTPRGPSPSLVTDAFTSCCLVTNVTLRLLLPFIQCCLSLVWLLGEYNQVIIQKQDLFPCMAPF